MSRFNLNKLRAHAIKSIKDAGLPIPEPQPPIEDCQRFPADLTKLSDTDLRQQMSFWKAQSARAEFWRARADVDELGAKESVKRHEQRFRILNPEYKVKWESEAAMADDEHYNDLVNKLTMAKAKSIMAKGIVDSFDHYWQSLSRELAARISDKEREMRDRAQ